MKTKHAAKWLADSFGQIDDPFLQLKTLEESIKEIHGKKITLVGEREKIGIESDKLSYSEVVKSSAGKRQEYEYAFEKHNKGIGRKIMERHGWKDGKGLGNGRKEGRKEAVEAKGQVASCKHGVGYREEGEESDEETEAEATTEDGWIKSSIHAQKRDKPVHRMDILTQNRFSPLLEEEEGEEEKEGEDREEGEDEEYDEGRESEIEGSRSGNECFMFKRKRGETKGEAKRRRKSQKDSEEESAREEGSRKGETLKETRIKSDKSTKFFLNLTKSLLMLTF